MKIRRLRLRNYRGIGERELMLPPTGVTVIEGPNEIGKSSLAEAIHIVFEHQDSTTKKLVKQVKPVDRDVGPEIEIEVETGSYRFTLFKRFLKKSETVLTLTAPRPENLTGREAHDRVQQILAETMDADLWKALSVVQGRGVQRVDVSHASALAEALDRAAGQEIAGDRESSIFDAVHAAYHAYFTDGDNERKPLKEVREATETARERVALVEGELRGLDELVGRSAQLERAVLSLRQQSAAAATNATRRQAELADLKQQSDRVKRLVVDSDHAAERLANARKDLATRRELIDKLEQAKQELSVLRERASANEPELHGADRQLGEARAECERSRRLAQQAAELLALRSGDLELHRAKFDLETLGERRARIEQALQHQGEAAALIERIRVTDGLLAEIKTIARDLERAEAQLDAGSPQLRVTALSPLAVELDGEHRELSRGQVLAEPVGQRVALAVPEVVEIEVTAGTSLDELVRDRDRHRHALRQLFDQADVADLAQAEQLHLARIDAERTVGEAKKAVADNLRDLELAQMDQKIERLTARVHAHQHDRPAEPPLPDNLDAARVHLEQAQGHHDEAADVLQKAEQRLRDVDSRQREIKERVQQASTELRVESKGLEHRCAELAAARDHASDAALEVALTEARAQAEQAKQYCESAERALEQQNPARVEELAGNAQRAAGRSAADLRNKEDELHAVGAKLEVLGEQGLYDALEQGRTRLTHAEQQQRAVEARAAAVALLYRTMRDKRDEARRAYAAPLRDKVIGLGRLIFDTSFDVQLDDSLAIGSRTLNGVTLPFNSLSVGAQEQLGLVMRLACSMLVDEQQGVPLIFDDALGHTDPERLEGMGAVLSRAGRCCQVIVLTCTPGRFAHVGGATVIDLGRAT